jgi:hypothetical protein
MAELGMQINLYMLKKALQYIIVCIMILSKYYDFLSRRVDGFAGHLSKIIVILIFYLY